jgi:two-component system NarL family sensor kinase
VDGTQPAGGQAAEMPAAAVRRFGLRSPRTATALGVLVLVLTIATLTLKGFDHQLTTSGTWSGIAIVVMYAGVGVVVARRQPRNPIGWLLLAFIALYVLGAGAVEYAVLAYGLGHRGLPLAGAAVVLDTLQAPSLALFPPVILLFPDGRLTSRRWRQVLWAYAVLTAYVAAVSAAQGVAAVAGHDIRLGTNGNLASTGQPGDWLANPPTWLAGPVLASIAAIGLSFVARQVLSWRRAGGERRQQLKWLASGAAIAVFSILLGVLTGSTVPLAGLAACRPPSAWRS